MKFSDIPGHQNAKERLRAMVATGRLPHALLLEGPAGIGKMWLARVFAQYIHCSNPTADGEPCQECQSCRLHAAMNHIDTTYIYPVVKLDKMKTPPVAADFIEEWKEYLSSHPYMNYSDWVDSFGKKNARLTNYVTESNALIHQLSFTSHISKKKIVIWWLPEKMNEEAANKLLKLIEEPFDDTIFIMVSDTPSEILPTIYSRIQRIALHRLPDNIVASYLTDNYSVDSTDALAIAHIAEGNVVAAISALHTSERKRQMLDTFISLMRLAYQRNVAALRDWSEQLAALGRDRVVDFYTYACRMIRENFIFNFHVPEISYLTQAEQQFSSRFSPFINEGNAQKLMETFSRAANDVAANANAKIVNLDVAIKTIMLLIKK